MSKTGDISAASRRAWLSVGLPIVALVFFFALGALAVFVNFARQQNLEFRVESQRLVQSALDGRTRSLSDITLDFASWNDAYRAISVQWNPQWVTDNFYSAVTDSLIIFRADGQARYTWFTPALRPDAPRVTIGAIHAAQDIPGVRQLIFAAAPSGTVAHGLFSVDGQLAIVAVAVVAPEDAASRLAIPHSTPIDFLASAQILEPNELAELGRSLNLRDLRFQSSEAAADPGAVALPLRSADGAQVGELRWRDERPGDRAFATQMAPVVLGLILIGALTLCVAFVLTRRQVATAAHAEAAIEADQLKSDFISSISNELTTPLNAIVGYAELIEEESRDHGGGDQIGQDAGRILIAARRLRQLVEDTLDQSRIDAGHLNFRSERVDVAGLLTEIVEILAPMARANGDSLETAIELHGLHFIGDHQRVRQCLLNLAGNAIKFTKDGAVRVRARSATRNGARFVTFDVTDTGIGIAAEHAEAIFEPFAQIDAAPERGGVGLGLAISRKLARAMGGDIVFVSEPGRGACFSLHVPVAAGVVKRGLSRSAAL
jgi:signal transduction histidine kinase